MSLAAQGQHTSRQRSFRVGDQKITIRSVNRTSLGNPMGFYVHINGERFHCNTLDRQQAEDGAYVRWVRKQAEVAK